MLKYIAWSTICHVYDVMALVCLSRKRRCRRTMSRRCSMQEMREV